MRTPALLSPQPFNHGALGGGLPQEAEVHIVVKQCNPKGLRHVGVDALILQPYLLMRPAPAQIQPV